MSQFVSSATNSVSLRRQAVEQAVVLTERWPRTVLYSDWTGMEGSDHCLLYTASTYEAVVRSTVRWRSCDTPTLVLRPLKNIDSKLLINHLNLATEVKWHIGEYGVPRKGHTEESRILILTSVARRVKMSNAPGHYSLISVATSFSSSR